MPNAFVLSNNADAWFKPLERMPTRRSSPPRPLAASLDGTCMSESRSQGTPLRRVDTAFTSAASVRKRRVRGTQLRHRRRRLAPRRRRGCACDAADQARGRRCSPLGSVRATSPGAVVHVGWLALPGRGRGISEHFPESPPGGLRLRGGGVAVAARPKPRRGWCDYGTRR